MTSLVMDIQAEFRGDIRRAEPMFRHTSWRIGGPAECYLIPADVQDLRALLRVLDRKNVPWIVVGNGTNLLVGDEGVSGAVISLERLDSCEIDPAGKVRVEAGMSLQTLVKNTVARGLTGLEDLIGIPGTVGGALVMNAGAGTAEIGTLVETVTLLDGDNLVTLMADAIDFSYRSSGLSDRGVLISADLMLSRGDCAKLQTRCQDLLEKRRTVQKVEGPHAGSVFKNPPQQSAWQLIDAVGLRGRVCGAAMISEVHCNHIVNLGEATAADVLDLMALVQKRVQERTGIVLEPEVHLVGCEVPL
ncbi:MAG: UDP-N-acetylenolpyruvoylglucosamine reductase [Desulfuromonas sp.]|nr:MAG: UDP-N-acetylenolpyruvoylglucosamine reductase [Desulfuromonas sp.]